MTIEKEAKIIKQVLDGDSDAFEQLVVANQDNVYRLSLKMSGNEQDAQDITQEAFIKAFLNLSSFRSESRFSVWMYRLTYNHSLDFLRKKSRSKTISLTETDDSGEEYELEIADLRHTPDVVLELEEKREVITQSIESLPKKQREIIYLREISGMSYSEIAKILNISEGTVKSRLARARLKLCNILIEKGTFPDHLRLEDIKPNAQDDLDVKSIGANSKETGGANRE